MSAPELSVIIPSHNRREKLQKLLESLDRQTQPGDTFEVIVADDESTDDTPEMLASLSTGYSLRHLRLEPNRGEWGAANAGIDAAAGGVCVFLDDDIVASPQLLAAHAAAHREDQRIYGLGKLTQVPPEGSDWLAQALARGWNANFDQMVRREVTWTDTFSGNLSVPLEGLKEVGGYSGEVIANGDAELGYRLWKAGYRPVLLPEAAGDHFDHKLGPRLLKDRQRHGRSALLLTEREAPMIPPLLGWFGAAARHVVLLRRLLLALRVPPEQLARMGPFLPSDEWRGRLSDFLSGLAYWGSVRKEVSRSRWVSITYGVPVLMYHAFSETDDASRYVVPKRTFARQMRLLKALRFHVISFEELARCLRENRLPPPRAVVVTIDDGYVDNRDVAEPILRSHGFSATLFLVSGRLGKPADWSDEAALAERSLLTGEELAGMRNGSFAFGAHSRTHPWLTRIPDDQVVDEIRGSRDDLEQALGAPISTFAYPYGDYDDRSIAAINAGGLIGAATAVERRLVWPNADPALIPRIEIEGTDSTLRFLIKLFVGEAD